MWIEGQGLWWVDISGREVFHATREGASWRTARASARFSALVRSPSSLWAISKYGIEELGPSSGGGIETRRRLSFREPLGGAEENDIHSNDAKAGPDGHLYVGTMARPPRDGAGSLYGVAPNGAGLAESSWRE